MRVIRILGPIAALAFGALLPSLAALAAAPSAAPPSARAGGASDLDPYGIAANGALVYAVDGDLYSADAAGAGATAITAGPGIDSQPSFSRDGTRIAFLREEGGQHPRLMVANADGSDILPLSDGTDLFDWSPTGAQLVVNHDVDAMPSVSIVEADGSGDVRTLDLGGIQPQDGWAAWRPTDGREIIFTGHPKTGSSDMGLYAIRPDGTGLRTIGAVSTTESDQQRSLGEPQLSPDGSVIAYWNWELSDAGVLDGYVHVRDLDTGLDHRVAVRPQPEAEIDPVFSPDGTSIAVEAQSETQELSELVVAPLDGSLPGVAMGPKFSYKDHGLFAFSPDGTKVVLTVNGATSVVDVKTGQTTALPGVPALPTWQRLVGR